MRAGTAGRVTTGTLAVTTGRTAVPDPGSADTAGAVAAAVLCSSMFSSWRSRASLRSFSARNSSRVDIARMRT